MPDFTYEALARTGTKSTGTLTANSEREAALILDGRGLFPLRIGLAKTQASGAGGFFGRRVKGRHLATFYSQLADLLHSGVPLLRSLELLERQSTNRTLQAVLRDVRARVADGTGLAAGDGASTRRCSTNSPSAWSAPGRRAGSSRTCSSASPTSSSTRRT